MWYIRRPPTKSHQNGKFKSSGTNTCRIGVDNHHVVVKDVSMFKGVADMEKIIADNGWADTAVVLPPGMKELLLQQQLNPFDMLVFTPQPTKKESI